MDKITRDTPDTDLIWAVLEGGPDGFPEASRLQVVSPIDDKIKIAHYGGYEHFERTDIMDKSGPFPQLVFRWATRTEVAE